MSAQLGGFIRACVGRRNPDQNLPNSLSASTSIDTVHQIRVRKRTKAGEAEAEDEEERGRKGREHERDKTIVECRSLFTSLLDGVFFEAASP